MKFIDTPVGKIKMPQFIEESISKLTKELNENL